MIKVPVKHLQYKSSALHQFAISYYNELGGTYLMLGCLELLIFLNFVGESAKCFGRKFLAAMGLTAAAAS